MPQKSMLAFSEPPQKSIPSSYSSFQQMLEANCVQWDCAGVHSLISFLPWQNSNSSAIELSTNASHGYIVIEQRSHFGNTIVGATDKQEYGLA
ncbi:hypothetical protein TNCV_4273131 [Trichonephila clavipes]|nr:hypothetical protein TNCV_4273131 [Trichonephila clavipes]